MRTWRWGICVLLLVSIGALAAPNVERIARGCERGRTKDCERLAALALNDQSHEVRAQAARSLRDSSVLAEIIRTEIYDTVIVAALENEAFVDSATFVSLARDDSKDGMVRNAATSRITDPAVLTELAMMPDLEVSEEEAKQILNPKVRANLARRGVRSLAAGRITDPALLTKIANHDPELRWTVVQNLTDPRLLAEIVKDPATPDLAIFSAIEKLDAATLAELEKEPGLAEQARTQVSTRLRKLALSGPDAAAKAAHLARTSADQALRHAAIEKLTDEETLVEIAITQEDPESAERALARVSDAANIERVAASSRLGTTRFKALRRLQRRDAALYEASLTGLVEQKAWTDLHTLVVADRQFPLSPEARTALSAVKREDGRLGYHLAQALLNDLAPSSWAKLSYDPGVRPVAFVSGPVPPGEYSLSIEYDDGRMRSRWSDVVSATLAPGRCYLVRAGVSGSQWSPSVVERPCNAD